MASKNELVRVFVKGGIISPADFFKITLVAESLGSTYVYFGSRQDILIPIFDDSKREKKILDNLFKQVGMNYDIGFEEFHNIVSSFTALDIMPRTSWLAPHIYHYILDSFDFQPRLKVNIVDPAQSMVPLFTGHINFIAAPQENYWYLYLHFIECGEKPFTVPFLVYGYEMAEITKAIQEITKKQGTPNYEQIIQALLEYKTWNTQPVSKPLSYPDTNFPYYEGMNRIGNDRYWLGLYWRNNQFTLKFLKAMCQLCSETRIGKISLTPWKSFVVHGIAEKDRLAWEKLMGKYGINMRHSALELNWHLPLLDQDALDLKNYIVRSLDQQDISTYGLTFTVKNERPSVLFTSVVIEKNNDSEQEGIPVYNILYSKNFNPNHSEYYYYAKKVRKETIAALLIELSKIYYEQLDVLAAQQSRGRSNNGGAPSHVWQCQNCLSLYDEKYGDPIQEIPANTPFESLPDDYTCSTCGELKQVFQQVEK